jgi:hypothetical protein
LSAALYSFGQREDATLFMTLLAAFNVLLYHRAPPHVRMLAAQLNIYIQEGLRCAGADRADHPQTSETVLAL